MWILIIHFTVYNFVLLQEDQCALHIAARLGNCDLVILLLQHGTPVDATTKEAYTALHVASKEGKEEVKTFLAKKISDHIVISYILGKIQGDKQ